MSNQSTLTIPLNVGGGSALLGGSPVDDILSKALSDSVACIFSSKVAIPFSDIRIKSVPQETHPVPAKWHVDVAIDDKSQMQHFFQ